MFACARLVDKACSNDDLPSQGSVLAEALQLCREDVTNITKLVRESVKKLDSTFPVVRLKALRLLLHLAQSGPPACQSEIKLYSSNVSNCMSWRGAPHPTKGYAIYNEIKEAAQQLLDLSFAAATQPTTTSFAVTNTSGGSGVRFAGVQQMDSYGSGGYVDHRASLEPRSLDPTKQASVVDQAVDFVSQLFGKEKPMPPSKYGSASNVSGNYSGTGVSTGYTPPYNPNGTYTPPYNPSGSSSAYSNTSPAYSNGGVADMPTRTYRSYAPPPPQRGQFDRLQQDASWTDKKTPAVPTKKAKSVDTPAAKLMKVTGGRALPTNGEITAFRETANEDSILELMEGLKSGDWKVKVRAIAGLDVIGEALGYGPVANVKDDVEKLCNAPQSSLKSVATKFYEKVKDVEPEAIPEAPSAFDFS